ncbi:major facilitator superfamily domain-containing protein [Fusarium flagelliforme]|uniref:major facilitator superfamily domain-containing protein n=1 Tax=Fusarium flagelliforme TaxID=2675880 RepID=UPI001E8E9659|nr:major facilitator superfamily domain-containing protein [Fusarium flagelliforme]KAH7192551.1 major facilitator superfamily domain-containing protein [Fusarium flagelliforme]
MSPWDRFRRSRFTERPEPGNLSSSTETLSENLSVLERPDFPRAQEGPTPAGSVDGSAREVSPDHETLEEFGLSLLERARDFLFGVFSSSDRPEQGPHPDRGWRPWLLILACFLVFMNTCGWTNSFGFFQAYDAENTSLEVEQVSRIGSLSAFLLFFVGALVSHFVHADNINWIFSVGIVFQSFGTILTPTCDQYWEYLGAQGVLVGLGHGLVFSPVLAVLSTRFAQRRLLRMGIAASGSFAGGALFTCLFQDLLPKVGYHWTSVIVSWVKLVSLVIAMILMKPRANSPTLELLIQFTPFKDIEYVLYIIASLCTTFGVYLTYFFLLAYSQTALDGTYPFGDSLTMFSVSNATGFLSILFFIASYFFGVINVSAPATLIAAIMLYSWMAVSSQTGLYVWSSIYGIFAATGQ